MDEKAVTGGQGPGARGQQVRFFGPLAPGVWPLLFLVLAGCGGSAESRIRRTLATQTSGTIQLPAGVTEVSSELVMAPGAHDLEIAGAGSLLKASAKFRGRAILVIEGARGIRLKDFSIDGNRAQIEKPLDMAPPENAFRVYYPNNGVLADRVEGLEISNLSAANVAGFPVLVSRSSGIRIHETTVVDSGSKNARGRNNLSGGILIEEGSTDFEVRDSKFQRVLGNGLWTHSLYTSPRLRNGLFQGNRFDTIGRDAIEVAHASRVRVLENTGVRIGYPPEVVDLENGGTPVAMDTAGNVDQSEYSGNQFEEINGKCIDLDGFHDGAVRDNRCLNRMRAQDYAFGHFGIVMNNTDPNVRSRNIEISANVIDGAKFGGLFLMGTGHRILDNRFLNLNTAGCNESRAEFGCIYKADEPRMLESGIYLGRGVARMEQTKGNLIRGNEISGHMMKTRCISAGPGVSLRANTVERNQCSDSAHRH